ncbi:hypothetical protein [Nitrosococcus wardiae]|uniref:DUF1640 domain-containing protein n=1 Tax=Nitrosococcus wardiae TaxID=1814290 RepID=A0A4P7BZP2_9GAMM|nr:hypothetical protein [Nitrosococcus wardiae]QBQ54002.1 hypothetical protein E3U44_05355 [Nitrosococcus wardiae]
MTVIVQEVYTAFKEAGVSEESARSAAEALTGYGDRFHDLEREMDRRFNDTDKQIMEVKGTQRLLQWMLGFNLALSVAVLFLLLMTGI